MPQIIISDEKRVKRILKKLILNSLKYTNQGNIIIKVKQLLNSVIKVSVCDSGIGISEEKMKQIF